MAVFSSDHLSAVGNIRIIADQRSDINDDM